MAIDFRHIESPDLQKIRSWFADPEISRWSSYPTDEWFDYVTTQEAVHCWVALRDAEPIAKIQVDGETGGRGYWDIAVRPDLRAQGLGTRVALAFLSGPGKVYRELVGMIAPDNAASIALSKRCGFAISRTPDPDGFLSATRQQPTC